MEKSSFQPWGTKVFLVKVGTYRNGEMTGHFQNVRFFGERPFVSTVELLLQIQELLDTSQCPCAKSVRTLPELYDGEKGPTIFQLEVFFTQNHSWQGRLTWLEKKQEASFRSVLELLIILDDVLSE